MLRKIKMTMFFGLLIAVFGLPSILRAQSLTGNTGLVTIPTARMQQDGTLSFGVSYFDKKNQQYFEGTKDILAAYVNLTLLPFLEVVMRVNRPINYQSDHYTVDRFPMVKLKLLNEKKYLPAIAFGINDFASTSEWQTVHFNATYLVLSKKVSVFDLHLGYAPIIMKALYYQLDGVFGGVAYTPHKSVNLYAEYDTRYVNAGIQYLFLKHFAVNLATINFNSLSAGINFKVFLK
jgi:hypothetical protein